MNSDNISIKNKIGGRTLVLQNRAYSVTIVKKSVKNITIRVKPNRDVIVTIPLDCNDKDIEYVLNKRVKWIEEKIAFFKAHNKIVQKEYVSGENFRYLGRNYRLKVIESNEEDVKLQRGYIQIFVKNRDDIDRKKGY